MKLNPEEVGRIVNRMVFEWRDQKLAQIQATDEHLKLKLTDIFIKELRVEDDLNAEVEKILTKYEKEFQKGTLDRRKMSLMVKNQLAKERKVVL